MCPVCLATVVLIAGGVASTGALTAIAVKKSGAKRAVDNHSSSTTSEETCCSDEP